ncbi:hypothetical protein ACET3Z_018558 [Daucus carota]
MDGRHHGRGHPPGTCNCDNRWRQHNGIEGEVRYEGEEDKIEGEFRYEGEEDGIEGEVRLEGEEDEIEREARYEGKEDGFDGEACSEGEDNGRKNVSLGAPSPDWERPEVNTLPNTCIRYVVLVVSLAGKKYVRRHRQSSRSTINSSSNLASSSNLLAPSNLAMSSNLLAPPPSDLIATGRIPSTTRVQPNVQNIPGIEAIDINTLRIISTPL